MLWIWQDVFVSLPLHTIPYSEFKQHLSKGNVIECGIGENEITGRIRGKYSPQTPQSAAATESSSPVTAESEKSRPEEATQDAAATEAANPPEYQFRTVRIEDPELVEELEAAGVPYEGVRPGFMSSLLVAWLLPIFLILLFWSFLARRIGGRAGGDEDWAESRPSGE